MYKLGKRSIASLLLLIVISLSLAACGGDNPTATPNTGANNPATAATPTTAMAMAAPTDTMAMAAPTDTMAMAAPTDTVATTSDNGGGNTGASSPEADLMRTAAANMKSLTSYHMDFMTTAAGQNITMAADVDTANNKMKMDTTTSGMSVSIIVDNNNSYMSTDGGKTYVASPQAGAMTQTLSSFINMWDNFSTSMPMTVTSALKDMGNETIDGVDCKHIGVNAADFAALSSQGGASAASGTVDMWISNDANPTFRQMQVHSTTSGTTADVTIKWSKFNEDLGIPNPGQKG